MVRHILKIQLYAMILKEYMLEKLSEQKEYVTIQYDVKIKAIKKDGDVFSIDCKLIKKSSYLFLFSRLFSKTGKKAAQPPPWGRRWLGVGVNFKRS